MRNASLPTWGKVGWPSPHFPGGMGPVSGLGQAPFHADLCPSIPFDNGFRRVLGHSPVYRKYMRSPVVSVMEIFAGVVNRAPAVLR